MRRSRQHPQTAPSDVGMALAKMSAEALREFVEQVLLELDDRAHARVVASLVARAARTGAGWAPAAVSEKQVAEVLAFVKAAERIGHADPSDVDAYLSRGSAAFLRKDYDSAHRIFGALLPAIGEGNVDLGQHELVDEVLGVDVSECAAQYVVSTYMLAPPSERAAAVRTAIERVQSLGHFWEPLSELERAAVEPLPDLAAFLPRWRTLIASKPASERKNDWDSEEDRWLREVVQRLEGAAGLAKVARATKRADDLRAWCRCLMEANEWQAALKAFAEAAELVTDKDYARGEFLDGAALSAQCLNRKDLADHLEKAWRAAPSVVRLRRWLGSASNKAALDKRVAEAMKACPKQTQQRALIHVLSHDFSAAAKLLASAQGLGWSHDEHPGHLLFPLFARLLGAEVPRAQRDLATVFHRYADLDERDAMTADPKAPRLATPEVDALLALARIANISDATSRTAVLSAMKRAAERRVAGVTEQKRRKHYDHAAELVATCVACDKTGDTARWAAALKAEYNRFPALRAEIARALGASR
jgi:tetratricopeptide (TPR) repeat protein